MRHWKPSGCSGWCNRDKLCLGEMVWWEVIHISGSGMLLLLLLLLLLFLIVMMATVIEMSQVPTSCLYVFVAMIGKWTKPDPVSIGSICWQKQYWLMPCWWFSMTNTSVTVWILILFSLGWFVLKMGQFLLQTHEQIKKGLRPKIGW